MTWTGGFLFWGRQKHLEKVGDGARVVATGAFADLQTASKPTLDTYENGGYNAVTILADHLDVSKIQHTDDLELEQPGGPVSLYGNRATDGSVSRNDSTNVNVTINKP